VSIVENEFRLTCAFRIWLLKEPTFELSVIEKSRDLAFTLPSWKEPGFVNIQGGAVNRGLKRFFSLYRPLHLIEAYVWPEKYWLVWAGPLANHPFSFNFIFLSDSGTAAAERATCFADLYHRYPVLFRSDEQT
jgi:hypothetical protein